MAVAAAAATLKPPAMGGATPRPRLLLALFCACALLLFNDRGTISCNSVNGKRATADAPGYGIQASSGRQGSPAQRPGSRGGHWAVGWRQMLLFWWWR